MCGRYTLHSHPAAVALQFGLAREPGFAPRYNIAPAADVLVVRELPGEGRETATMRWGLVPSWARDSAATFINARSETAAQKPAFRDALRKRRCLLPANGFYEWKALGGRKQPYYIRPASDEL
jgi:putative SOS response-associated peptidase YedK